MRLMSTSLLVLPLSTSLILLTDCLEVGAVVLIVTELVAAVGICVAEAPPRPAIPLDELELEQARLSAQIFRIIRRMSARLHSFLLR